MHQVKVLGVLGRRMLDRDFIAQVTARSVGKAVARGAIRNRPLGTKDGRPVRRGIAHHDDRAVGGREHRLSFGGPVVADHVETEAGVAAMGVVRHVVRRVGPLRNGPLAHDRQRQPGLMHGGDSLGRGQHDSVDLPRRASGDPVGARPGRCAEVRQAFEVPAGAKAARGFGRTEFLDLHDLRDLGRRERIVPHGDGGGLPRRTARRAFGLTEAEITVAPGRGWQLQLVRRVQGGFSRSHKLPVNIELQLQFKIDGNGEVIPFPGLETVLQVLDVCIDSRDGICGGADLHEKRRPVGAP